MPVTSVYRKSPEINANYDFQDIITDSGFVELYLYGTATNSEESRRVSRKRLYTALKKTEITNNSSREDNWDYEFFVPQRIEGNLNFVTTLQSEDSNNDTKATIKVRPLKVDENGNEKELAPQKEKSTTSNNDENSERVNLLFEIGRTLIRKNEKIRMEIILRIHDTSAIAKYFHSPNDEATTASGDPSDSIIYIPFELNL